MQRLPLNEERLSAFDIKQLGFHEMKTSLAYAVGNDPLIEPQLDKHSKPTEKIALVATSGMRAISLACKLGNQERVPNIYLVDYNINVYFFWLALRDFFAKQTNVESFRQSLPELILLSRQTCHQFKNEDYHENGNDRPASVVYLNQSISVFFEDLLTNYPYEYIRSIVLNATIIRQDWCCTDTFKKLKAMINADGIEKIYIYASNIVACQNTESSKNKVLENIQCMNPVMVIHTSVSYKYACPKYVYMLEEADREAVKKIIFPKGSTFSGKPKGASPAGLDATNSMNKHLAPLFLFDQARVITGNDIRTDVSVPIKFN